MAQITGIGFSNFRVFEKKTFFDLAPISIFTGTNSSGKSSVFKALLLLADNSHDLTKLKFSGDKHKLGTILKSKSRGSLNDKFTFQLKIDQRKNSYLFDKLDLKLVYNSLPANEETAYLEKFLLKTYEGDESQNCLIFKEKEQIDDNGSSFPIRVAKLDLEYIFRKYQKVTMPLVKDFNDELNSDEFKDGLYSVSPTFEPFDPKLLDFVGYDFSIVSIEKLADSFPFLGNYSINDLADKLKALIINHWSLLIFFKNEEGGWDYSETGENFENFEDLIDIIISNFSSYWQIGRDKFVFETLKEESQQIKDVLSKLTLEDILDDTILQFLKVIISPQLEILNFNLKSSLKDIQFLEAIRGNSQRLYSNHFQGTNFNELLLELGQNWNLMFKDSKIGNFKIEFINKWLRKFEIGDSLKINRINGVATEVIVGRMGEKVDLVDLGYGVTQFLPILLHVATRLKRRNYYDVSSFFKNGFKKDLHPLLLIEEPESNLHPKLQSLLADFFIDVAKTFEVTLLIETHSEYLIRRLQVLTASGEAKPEDSVIYYLNGEKRAEDGNQVTKININPDGSLTNDFGSGFIDEATNWKLELMRLKNAKLHEVNLN